METSLLEPLDSPGRDNQQTDDFVQKTLLQAVRHLDSPEALDRCYTLQVRMSEDTLAYIFHTPIPCTLKTVDILSEFSDYDFSLKHGDDEIGAGTVSASGVTNLFTGELAMAAGEFLSLTPTEAVTAGIVTIRVRPTMIPRNS